MTTEAREIEIPRLCVVIGRTRHKMVQAEIQEAARRGAELIELRLDYLGKAPDFKRLLHKKSCQMLATVRRPIDGGRWGGSEESRLMLLRQAIVGGFDWVDLEIDIIDKIPRFGTVRRVVSYHNMKTIPSDLEAIHSEMCKKDADVVKVAVRASNPSDAIRVLRLLPEATKPTVAIAMGDFGAPTRILGAKWGAPFSYAAFNKERSLAPGLLSFDDMQRIYHYPQINSETMVYGVVGDPIGHSLSPLVHNTAFRHLGINAVYVPFRVPRGELEEQLRLYNDVPVNGYSVTIPHKEDAASLAKDSSPKVELTQAANTLIRQEDGTFFADNTDYSGALEAILAHIPRTFRHPEEYLASRPILILGAGGVARAIAFALKQSGALLTIANRTQDKAMKLAEDLGCRFVGWPARHSVKCDAVINCTSIGMHPHVDESPLHNSFFRPDLIAFDTVYNPETTLFLKEARHRGCEVVSGVDLFVRQAASQFRLFTGQEPPLELMTRVVKKALSPLRKAADED